MERAVERERLRENLWQELHSPQTMRPPKKKKVELKSVEKDNDWPRGGRTSARDNSADVPIDDAIDLNNECPPGGGSSCLALDVKENVVFVSNLLY